MTKCGPSCYDIVNFVKIIHNKHATDHLLGRDMTCLLWVINLCSASDNASPYIDQSCIPFKISWNYIRI